MTQMTLPTFFLNMPGLMELLPILIVVVLLFGASRLLKLARSLGQSITEFKKGVKSSPEEKESLESGDDPPQISED